LSAGNGFFITRRTTCNDWASNGWDFERNFICRFWTLNKEVGTNFWQKW
jgi:hypothetical protein